MKNGSSKFIVLDAINKVRHAILEETLDPYILSNFLTHYGRP